MKKTLLVVTAVIMVSGCAAPSMNNDQIIVEALKCEAAGLEWRQTYDYKGAVRNVYCTNPNIMRRNN